MIIHTKYNEGDEIWCLHDNEITRGLIKTICIAYPTYSLFSNSNTKLINIQYFIIICCTNANTANTASITICKEESKLFKTKKELIKNLLW